MEDRLHKFAQVVDSQGFSRAAAAMHVSQPALTAAVKKLERELGVELLERSNKRIVLTRAGEAAYQTAKQVRSDVRNLRQELTALAGARQTVRLGLIDSIAELLAGSDDGFAPLKQHTDLSIVVDNSGQLTNAVIGEKLDAAIIVGDPSALPDILSDQILGQEPLALIMHPEQQAAYRRALARGRLPNFLSYNIGSHSQALIESGLLQRGITIEPTFYSTSPEVMLKMVQLGQGVVILPYSTVKNEIESGQLSSLPIGRSVLTRPIHTIKLRGQELLPEVERIFISAAACLKQLSSTAHKPTV